MKQPFLVLVHTQILSVVGSPPHHHCLLSFAQLAHFNFSNRPTASYSNAIKNQNAPLKPPRLPLSFNTKYGQIASAPFTATPTTPTITLITRQKYIHLTRLCGGSVAPVVWQFQTFRRGLVAMVTAAKPMHGICSLGAFTQHLMGHVTNRLVR